MQLTTQFETLLREKSRVPIGTARAQAFAIPSTPASRPGFSILFDQSVDAISLMGKAALKADEIAQWSEELSRYGRLTPCDSARNFALQLPQRVTESLPAPVMDAARMVLDRVQRELGYPLFPGQTWTWGHEDWNNLKRVDLHRVIGEDERTADSQGIMSKQPDAALYVDLANPAGPTFVLDRHPQSY